MMIFNLRKQLDDYSRKTSVLTPSTILSKTSFFFNLFIYFFRKKYENQFQKYFFSLFIFYIYFSFCLFTVTSREIAKVINSNKMRLDDALLLKCLTFLCQKYFHVIQFKFLILLYTIFSLSYFPLPQRLCVAFLCFYFSSHKD